MTTPPLNRGNSLPGPLKIFAAGTVALTLLSWLFAFICYLLGLPRFYSWPYPYGEPQSDINYYQGRFEHLHTMQFFTMGGPPYLYPAPLSIVYHLLYTAWSWTHRPNPSHILTAFTLVAALVTTTLFFRALRRRGISAISAFVFCAITLILSFPLYYEYERGNLEVFLWVDLMIAIWALRTGRLTLSAVLIGVATACKWYPVILLGVFLYPKKWKPIPTALLTAALVTVLSDWWLGPTLRIAAEETRKGMQLFISIYGMQGYGGGNDHSFFGFFKALVQHHPHNFPAALARYLKLAAVAATALYFFRIRRLPIINQIIVLMILSIVLPPVSFDYTLLHLYVCFGLFTLYVVDACRIGVSVPKAGWIMAWFAFAMAPHSYAVHHGLRYTGQTHLIGLVALLYFFLRYPYRESPLFNRGAALEGSADGRREMVEATVPAS